MRAWLGGGIDKGREAAVVAIGCCNNRGTDECYNKSALFLSHCKRGCWQSQRVVSSWGNNDGCDGHGCLISVVARRDGRAVAAVTQGEAAGSRLGGGQRWSLVGKQQQ